MSETVVNGKGRVVIAGGSGAVGRALIALLRERGYEPLVLSRSERPVKGARVVRWNGRDLGMWKAEVEGAAAVVNLAGAPIMSRWTPKAKARILRSRVDSTTALGRAVAASINPPRAWVNASAVGWYGNTGSKEVSEASPNGKGFLAEVARAWEAAVDALQVDRTRKVKVRFGFVLGKDGAFPLLARLTKLFLGGALGSGRQFVSWVHARDLARMMVWAIEGSFEGVLNGTAPRPATNSELMAALRRHLRRPFAPAAPGCAVEMLSQLGGPPAELVLWGQRAVPALALAHGFEFEFPTLDAALTDLVGR